MNLIPESTYKIVAFTEIPHFNTDECVDWAVEMLELGYDTPNLLILGGFDKPTNPFETIEYLLLAFDELKLIQKKGIEGIISYSSIFIWKIGRGQNVFENLALLNDYVIETDYDESIYDFNLLYEDWNLLSYGHSSIYFSETNASTIIADTIRMANKWIIDNKEIYEQPF